MTAENWINVAMIIAVIMTAAATLVGPVLAVYVQVRMSQPKPSPDAKQPANETQRSRMGRYLAVSLIFAFEVSVLIWIMRSSTPLSKLSAFTVSVYVSSLLFIILGMIVMYLSSKISEAFILQLENNRLRTLLFKDLDRRVDVVVASLTTVFNDDAARAKSLLQDLKAITAKPELGSDQSK